MISFPKNYFKIANVLLLGFQFYFTFTSIESNLLLLLLLLIIPFKAYKLEINYFMEENNTKTYVYFFNQ